MRVCSFCGASNDSSALCCSECGKMLENENTYDAGVHYGTASIGWWFIGFINFIAGFILGSVLKAKMPDAAHKAKCGAIVGLIVCVVFYVIYFLMLASIA